MRLLELWRLYKGQSTLDKSDANTWKIVSCECMLRACRIGSQINELTALVHCDPLRHSHFYDGSKELQAIAQFSSQVCRAKFSVNINSSGKILNEFKMT